jgi:alanyl-tRNA synthetase
VYAGYVLHTCVTQDPEQSLAGLEVDCDATLEVDYARRRKTAPNHTMTHTLNFALRQVRTFLD